MTNPTGILPEKTVQTNTLIWTLVRSPNLGMTWITVRTYPRTDRLKFHPQVSSNRSSLRAYIEHTPKYECIDSRRFSVGKIVLSFISWYLVQFERSSLVPL